MKKIIAILLLLSSTASAQNPGVTTQGAVTNGDCVKFVNRNLIASNGAACATGTVPVGANPTAQVGLTAVNGSATTFMRSDGAPALDQTAAFAFSGLGATRITANGALSSGAGPAFAATGTWITGGSATTTKPYFLIETTGATSTGWSTSGTGLGINAATGFVGHLISVQVNGANRFLVNNSGAITLADNSTVGRASIGNPVGNIVFNSSNVVETSFFQINSSYGLGGSAASPNFIGTAPSSAVFQLGNTAAASPVAQTLQAQGSRAGTDSNVGGANITVQSGTGTGSGTLSSVIIAAPITAVTATGAQTMVTGWTIKQGVAASTGYTVATLPTSPAPLTGARAHVTDALNAAACVFFGVIVAGGTTVCPVFYTGAAWVGG